MFSSLPTSKTLPRPSRQTRHAAQSRECIFNTLPRQVLLCNIFFTIATLAILIHTRSTNFLRLPFVTPDDHSLPTNNDLLRLFLPLEYIIQPINRIRLPLNCRQSLLDLFTNPFSLSLAQARIMAVVQLLVFGKLELQVRKLVFTALDHICKSLGGGLTGANGWLLFICCGKGHAGGHWDGNRNGEYGKGSAVGVVFIWLDRSATDSAIDGLVRPGGRFISRYLGDVHSDVGDKEGRGKVVFCVTRALGLLGEERVIRVAPSFLCCCRTLGANCLRLVSDFYSA